MRDQTPSRTAAWVAFLRGLGRSLPRDLQLSDDPFGLSFASVVPVPGLALGGRVLLERLPMLAGQLRTAVVALQLRSRAIDDAVLAFVRGGGRQIVILGAGFDCRAWRLFAEDRDVTVFEVDHPATQRRKRERMAGERGARVRFLAWNFEHEDLQTLPDRLADLGFAREAPTMTILEGVTMYLTPAAIEATFACIRGYGGDSGSSLAFTYSAAQLLRDTSPEVKRERWLVRAIGEPFRFGFEPDTLEAWLKVRGFQLESNESLAGIAKRLLEPERARPIEASAIRRLRYVAVASYARTP
jgi:methyltransferase (TIGR00027 family)